MGMFRKQSLPTCRAQYDTLLKSATLWLMCNLNKRLLEHEP